MHITDSIGLVSFSEESTAFLKPLDFLQEQKKLWKTLEGIAISTGDQGEGKLELQDQCLGEMAFGGSPEQEQDPSSYFWEACCGGNNGVSESTVIMDGSTEANKEYDHGLDLTTSQSSNYSELYTCISISLLCEKMRFLVSVHHFLLYFLGSRD